MSIKLNNYIFIFLCVIFLFTSCNKNNGRPSPKEVAQFNLDVYNKNFEAVKSAIEKNQSILNIGYQAFGDTVFYPLYMAIQSKDVEMVKLIANKNNVNEIFVLDSMRASPLMLALMVDCNYKIIKNLLNEGADINYIDEIGKVNVFHYFSNSRSKDVWNVLKEYSSSANLNMEADDKSTPISCLIASQVEHDDLNNLETISLLKDFIDCGANPNYLINYRDYAFSLVEYLNENNFLEYEKVLLEGMKNNSPVGDSEELIKVFEVQR